MFRKILIANRGEIACRIIRTARTMGIRAVAVYSEADRDALYVRLADEAVCIGPAPSAESYLSIEKIVQACKSTGAQAVHPGYGFLAENAGFAARLASAAIAFVGPGVRAIERMGDKIAAKRLAAELGIPTIPGSSDVVADADQAARSAREIGYPVMLKARAGGGGKAMRIARNDDECREAFARAAAEARASFGDDGLMIEKRIDVARHIEVQILADRHGNVIHLGERECSLQRRHQKVIEETPAVSLDSAIRRVLCENAVGLARAVDYESAGTVEFLVDAGGNAYFLEMNTRLQVEHPVTEMATGVDLVEWMIRIAAGEALSLSQSDVAVRGCAIEARIYAEDPTSGFLPSVGRLVRYLPATESDSVRVDTGVVEGSEVSIHYDPMIAKLITCGPARDEAIAQMRESLDEFVIRGVANNLSFLAALVDHERFRRGRLDTNLIADEFPGGFRPLEATGEMRTLLIAVAVSIHMRYRQRAAQIDGRLPGYEPKPNASWTVVFGGVQTPASARTIDGGHEVDIDGAKYPVVSDWQFGQPLFYARLGERSICVQVERQTLSYRLTHRGTQTDVFVLTPRAAELLACIPALQPALASKFLRSPMPGLLRELSVSPGHEVRTGQNLAVVEAMKMENVLCSPRDGKVAALRAAVGETLALHQTILEFE